MRSSSSTSKTFSAIPKLPKINEREKKPQIKLPFKNNEPKKIIPNLTKKNQNLIPKQPNHTFLKKNNRILQENKNIKKNDDKEMLIVKPVTLLNKEIPQEKILDFPKITWDDFKGQSLPDSWYLAQIYWYISYEFLVKPSPNFRVEVCAKCEMNKNRSWSKTREYDELLEHEQGHYNIGFLCALAFEKRVKRTKFSKEDYKEEIKTIFNETMKEYCKMERLYDEETYHMLNEDMQKKWNEDLKNELKKIQL